MSSLQVRVEALHAASRAVRLLPQQRDPEQAARRTIAVAAIFENYITNGRADAPDPSREGEQA